MGLLQKSRLTDNVYIQCDCEFTPYYRVRKRNETLNKIDILRKTTINIDILRKTKDEDELF